MDLINFLDVSKAQIGENAYSKIGLTNDSQQLALLFIGW